MAYATIDNGKSAAESDAAIKLKKESLTDNSLSVAGTAYLIGDAALFAAGLLKSWQENGRITPADIKGQALTGAIWALGGVGAARYGNPTAEKQLEILSARLGDYLKQQGITIPQNPTTELLARKGGVIDHIEKFLYAHPSEALNAAYAVGSLGLISEGMSGLGKKSGAFSDLATGVLVAAGALTGLLIPEKKPDPQNPPKGMFAKAMSWVQEKPLRLSSAFYWAGNAFLLKNVYDNWNTNRASSIAKLVTAGSYIFANAMLSMSSKGHSDNKKEGHVATQKLADSAAVVIAAQPQEVQNALVEQISGFLASQPETQMKANDISKLLHDKLKTIGKPSPTAPATGGNNWQAKLQNQPAASASPTL
jgi:hypothetical protein